MSARGEMDTSMRAHLRTLLLLFGLAGCSESQLFGPGTALTAAEAQGRIVLTSAACQMCLRWSQSFYIVRREQLARIRRAHGLTYLGTQNGFHFFQAWNKMVKEGEIDHVAVHLEQCEVSDPLLIDEERTHRRHRRVELRDAQCMVR
jgi:hypothetical protein